MPYEARVSYLSSCGCRSAASDSSAPCVPCWVPPTSPACSPGAVQPLAMTTPVLQSAMCGQVPLQPCSPSAPPQQTCIVTQVSNPSLQMQMSPCSPCTPHMQSGSPNATVQVLPCSPCSPSVAVHVQPSMPLLPTPPPPPEVLLSNEAGAEGLCIRWQSVGPTATGYVLELCEGSSGSTERFVRQAPAQQVGTVELCVGGLVPGRAYAACVRSIFHSGQESAPSAWSNWQSIPAAMQPHLQPVVASPQHLAQASLTPKSVLEKVEESDLEADVKKVGMAGVLLPPEVTGHEEGLLLLD